MMVQQHAELPDAGRVSHFEVDAWLPAPNEKAALVGDPVPAGDANRYLTQNHPAGGFSGFANPTASVGLVAVNGVATTAMRSDGAPALDQGITPTWTGLHTFGAGLAVSAGQGIALADGTSWIGIGAALERINIDAAGRVTVMGATFGVGQIATDMLSVLDANSNTLRFSRDASTVFTSTVGMTATACILRLDADLVADGSGIWYRSGNRDWFGGITGATDNKWVIAYEANAPFVAVLSSGETGFGTVAPDRLTHAEASTAETVAIAYANRLSHTTSGAAAPLFGVGQEHELEDAGGAMQVASEVVTLWAASTAGAESPLWRVSTHPAGAVGPGYAGFWTWDTLDDNARTVIPNGAGDVTSGITIMYRLRESGGGSEGNVVMVANGGAVDLYDDGVDVFTLTVNADGSVTVVRSAGASTVNLGLLMCWL